MNSQKKSQANAAVLLGGMTLAAVASFCGGENCPAVITALGGLLGFLSGVAGNQAHSWLTDKADALPPDPEDLFRNHHVRDLIGQAAQTVLREAAGRLAHEQSGTMQEAIEGFPAALSHSLDQPGSPLAQLYEFNLPDLLSEFAARQGQLALLTPEIWSQFLAESFHDLWPAEREAAAAALHGRLGEALWNHVKLDASQDGEAYAATELLYLSRILRAVEQRPAGTPAPDTAAVEARVTALIAQLDERHSRWFERLWSQAERHHDDDQAGHRRTHWLLQLVLKRLQDTPKPKPANAPSPDISRILKYAPEKLIGREAELKLLKDTWAKVRRGSKKRPHILTFVALGGEGKTSLVAKWAVDQMLAKDWPGCDAAFAWSFYSQGTREQLAASSDLFLKEALTFFGDEEMANSNQGAFEKGRRLAQLCGERRSLLILDGLEPLQYAPTAPTPGELRDQGVAALLKGLAAASHGLCVVTTRYSLPDLKAFWQTTAPEVKLLRLSRDAGVHLLKTLGVRGTAQEFATLVEDVKGHALTLTLLGTYLRDAHGGDIRKRDLVKLEEADAESDHPHHAFHVMDAYVKWLESGGAPSIARPESQATPLPSDARRSSELAQRALAILRLLGLFDRPATADCLGALWNGEAIPGLTEPLVGLNDAQRNKALTRLQDAKLLTVNRDAAGALVSLDAHPHIREYFAKQLRAPTGQNKPAQGSALGSAPADSGSPERATQGAGVSPLQGLGDSGAAVPGALPQAGLSRPVGAESGQPASDAWRAAHRRLYEHLCATTKEGDQPTLEDLQPLYQAVAHGCQAGLQQKAYDEVHLRRIRRRDDYAVHKLGAFGAELGALACFFERAWSKPSDDLKEETQSILLNNAAFRLRALGRLTEAIEPMRVSGEMDAIAQEWKGAAISYSNLSELELTLGEVVGAVRDAEQSVTYADRSGDAFQRMSKRATHADALHQAGRRAEAETRFREAEQMQKERQPAYPLLYSLPGCRYCDLLLAAPERAAWGESMKDEGRRMKEGRASVLECGGGAGAELPLSAGSAGGVPGSSPARPADESGGEPPHSKTLREVRERAAQTLKWSTELWNHGLLTVALDHLTLGRAALYAAILNGGAALPRRQAGPQPGPTGEAGLAPAAEHRRPTGEDDWATARLELAAAVAGLRRAGTQHEIPRALLTRAWLRFLDPSANSGQAAHAGAQEDLDEAWEIAERGPMKLFMADIHLTRCRLFGSGKAEVSSNQSSVISGESYPWESPVADLEAAAKLIQSCGYHRRDEELEDARQAILGR